VTAAAPAASRPRRRGAGPGGADGPDGSGGPVGAFGAFGTAANAALSVLACLVIAAAAVLLTPRPSTDVAVPINYQGDLAALRRIAPYPVIAPLGLPASWQPVSSRLTGSGPGSGHIGGLVSWHLGFVTPSGTLGSLEESNERPAEFIRRMTNSGNLLPPVTYGGVEWARRWRPDKGQRSLYHSTPGGPTVVITGNASWAGLETLLGSLRPQPRQPQRR
jgi:hypothetical protein